MHAVYENNQLVDSGELARRWEAANFARAMELNDVLFKMTLPERRVFVQTLTEEEKNGLIPEYTRRRNNEQAPTGSIVTNQESACNELPPGHQGPRQRPRSISIWERRQNSVTSVCYYGVATVLGHIGGYGSSKRLLFLHETWVDREGYRITYGEADCWELKVLA